MRASNLPLVVLWMCGALVSFSLSAISIRVLQSTLGVFEILACRSLIGIALLGLAALAVPRLRPGLRMRRPGLHVLRNVPHTVGQAGWSYGITAMPLATVFALEFTSPLWLAVLAAVFLGERMTVPRVGALVLGLLGVLVVLRPGAASIGWPGLAVLAAAFSFALTGVVTRTLTATETTFSILFWMNMVQLPLNLLGSRPDFLGRIEPAQVWGAAALGVSGVASHLCLTQAYRHGEATVVIPLDFLRIPLIAFVGWRFYGEALDGWVFAGAAIIVSGILWNLLAEARKRRSPPATSSRTPGSGPAS